MRREKEFADFLTKEDRTKWGTPNAASSINNYLTYCRNIEKAYDNKLDMEDIVARNYDFDSILLKLIDYRKLKRQTVTMSTLNACENGLIKYKKFVAAHPLPSATSPTITSGACGGDIKTPLVKYESSVFPSQQVAGLCRFIEGIYPDVIAYAENVLGYAGNVFGDLISNNMRRIPVFLSKEQPEKTYLPDVDEVTKRICERCEYFCEGCKGRDPGECEHCDGCDMYDRYKNILDILQTYKEVVKARPIAGHFFTDPQPHIVLYFNHFDMANFWESVAQTLAHEYLHYLHYSYAHSDTNDYHKHKELSEALADFFCVQYSLSRGAQAIAQSKYNAWQKRQNTTWPYWWALRFLPQPYRRNITDYAWCDWIQKYLTVVAASTNSDRAFELLKKD